MAFNFSPKIVTDGLFLYLDAANTRSYPGTGTVWTDLSRSGNNFSIFGSFGFTSSNMGSLTLNGGYAQINQNVLLSLNSYPNWSIEIWVYRTGDGASYRSDLFGIDVIYNVNSTNMYISNAPSPKFTVRGDGNNASYNMYPGIVSNTIILYNTWYQLSVVKNGTTIKIYVNGVEDNSVISSNFYWSDLGVTAKIGNRTDGDVQFFGRIPIFRIYREKALSSQEILQNYNATKSRFGLT